MHNHTCVNTQTYKQHLHKYVQYFKVLNFVTMCAWMKQKWWYRLRIYISKIPHIHLLWCNGYWYDILSWAKHIYQSLWLPQQGPFTQICLETLFFHSRKKRKLKFSNKMVHCPLSATLIWSRFKDLVLLHGHWYPYFTTSKVLRLKKCSLWSHQMCKNCQNI